MKKFLNNLKNHFVPHDGNDHHPHFFRDKSILFLSLAVVIIELAFLVQVLFVFNKTNFLAAVLPGVLTSLTNEQRLQNNAPLLTENPVLVSAAQLKANDMASRGYFSHNTPDGKTPWYFLDQVNYKYSLAGENLAINFFESIDVANAWMASPTHRANIVKKDYTEIGIAVASGTYEGRNAVFVVQFFGKPLNNTVPRIPIPNPTIGSNLNNTITEATNVLGKDVEVAKKIVNNTVAKTLNKAEQNINVFKREIDKIDSPVDTNTTEEILVEEKDNPLALTEENLASPVLNSLNYNLSMNITNKIKLVLSSPNKLVNNIFIILSSFIFLIFLVYIIKSKISHSFVFTRVLGVLFIIFIATFFNMALFTKAPEILEKASSFTSIAL